MVAGIDEVLERLVSEPRFRTALEEDPAAALAGYDLNESDLEVLSAQLDPRAGSSGQVEQRTSKSGLLAGMMGGGVASGAVGDQLAAPSGESPMKLDGFLKISDVSGESSAPSEAGMGTANPLMRIDEIQVATQSDSGRAFLADTMAADIDDIEMDVHVGKGQDPPPEDLAARGRPAATGDVVDGVRREGSGPDAVSTTDTGPSIEE